MRIKVLLRSPILTVSGYSAHAKLIYNALLTREDLFDIYLIPLNWGQTAWQHEDTPWRVKVDQLINKTAQYVQLGGQFDLSIQVTIPQEFQRIAPVNIGVTALTESTKASALWIQKMNEMDLIMVPSQFTKWVAESSEYVIQQNGIESVLKLATPVEVVPYHVSEPFAISEELKIDNIPDFNFLSVCQWGPRKNVENLVKWFVEEFFNENVGLILKLNKINNSIVDRMYIEKALKNLLAPYANKKCKVTLIHGYLNEMEMQQLYTHSKIKALINISHGEGFGLPEFEAVQHGLPVITTDFSGHVDFLYCPEKGKTNNIKMKAKFASVPYELKYVQPECIWENVIIKESQWAFADMGGYKLKLRDVYRNYDRFVAMAKDLKKYVNQAFAKDKVQEKIVKLVAGREYKDLNDVKYIFVSDYFADQLNGGAELSLQALIDEKIDESICLNSNQISEDLINKYKDKKWVFGNYTLMNKDLISLFRNVDYSIIEFDFKFCENRLPSSHECRCESLECGKLIKEFMANAHNNFFMSQRQLDIFKEHGIVNSGLVLSSVFDKKTLDYIDNVKQYVDMSKKDIWAILDSKSPVKGTREAVEEFSKNGKKYELIGNLPYEQLLEKLKSYKGLYFHPSGFDTCPRIVIEARLLGLSLDLNDNVLHREEEWFSGDNSTLREYIDSRIAYFWSKIE